MGFMDAVKSCFGKYATFSGRASRSEYWFFVLFVILVLVALGIVAAIFAAIKTRANKRGLIFTDINKVATGIAQVRRH